MKILAKFMKVNAILIAERIPEPEGTEEPEIIIEAIKEWGEWDFSLGEKGTQGYLANFIELDIDSSLILEGLEVERISWINNAMCVYFPYPTDIVIVDTGEILESVFEPLESPLSSIIISNLRNYETVMFALPENGPITLEN